MTDPVRILIYRCGAIGDTIVAIPAIRAIRERYPRASFLLMTAAGGEKIVWTDHVLREFGWFDEVITYEAKNLRSPVAMWRFAQHIRSRRLDLVFYLSTDKNSSLRILRDRLFFLLAGVRRLISTHSDKIMCWGHLRHGPRLYPYETDRLMAGLRRSGLPTNEVRFDLPINTAQIDQVDAMLKQSGMNLSRPLITMCPGSKQKIKVWPEDRFAEIGQRLINETDVNIAIVGGSDETEIGDRLVVGWPAGRAANFAQKLSILESAELLRRSLFYLGNDTGAMHIAAAVGTRCVAIFTAREPARSWHPYGDNHAILRKSVPCQNCYLADCVAQRRRCILEIAVNEVWAACQRMLLYR